jgi:hypothetical protein
VRHLRLVEPYDEPTYALHRNQFAARGSGLSLDHFRRPWYEKRRWRWTAIAVLVLALMGLAVTGTGVASW